MPGEEPESIPEDKEPVVTAPTVFISYSHKDEIWKDQLCTQLGVLVE